MCVPRTSAGKTSRLPRNLRIKTHIALPRRFASESEHIFPTQHQDTKTRFPLDIFPISEDKPRARRSRLTATKKALLLLNLHIEVLPLRITKAQGCRKISLRLERKVRLKKRTASRTQGAIEKSACSRPAFSAERSGRARR